MLRHCLLKKLWFGNFMLPALFLTNVLVLIVDSISTPTNVQRRRRLENGFTINSAASKMPSTAPFAYNVAECISDYFRLNISQSFKLTTTTTTIALHFAQTSEKLVAFWNVENSLGRSPVVWIVLDKQQHFWLAKLDLFRAYFMRFTAINNVCMYCMRFDANLTVYIGDHIVNLVHSDALQRANVFNE